MKRFWTRKRDGGIRAMVEGRGGGAGAGRGGRTATHSLFFLQTAKRSLSFLLFSFHLSIHLPQADGRSREFLRSRFPAARKT